MAKKDNAIQIYDINTVMERMYQRKAEPKEIAHVGQLFKDLKGSEAYTAMLFIISKTRRMLLQGRDKPEWNAEYVLGKMEGVQFVLDMIDNHIQTLESLQTAKASGGEQLLTATDD